MLPRAESTRVRSAAPAPLIEHVERVANTLPTELRGLAYLQEVLERAEGAMEELHELQLNEIELRSLFC
jgi:hypothetical protein